MEQNKVQATTGITFRILVALSICHCLNDTLQSVISAVYPLFKEDLGLSFAQIGLITLVYQSAASVCQPLTGLFFDKWPSAWSLPTGMSFTLVGLLSLAFANTLPLVLCSVALVGIGSMPNRDHHHNRSKSQDRKQGDMPPPVGGDKNGCKQRSQRSSQVSSDLEQRLRQSSLSTRCE